MSVIATVQLPDVPSPAGVVDYVSLGGNGFTAPRGMYTLRNFAVAGDATGGEHSLLVIMDPNYCSMIGYATAQIDVAAAAHDFHFGLASSAVPLQALNLNNQAPLSAAIAGSQIAVSWMPPAFVSPGTAAQVPTFTVSTQNIDTEILNLQMIIFLFDIRAREFTSYEDLIGARGGMYSNPNP